MLCQVSFCFRRRGTYAAASACCQPAQRSSVFGPRQLSPFLRGSLCNWRERSWSGHCSPSPRLLAQQSSVSRRASTVATTTRTPSHTLAHPRTPSHTLAHLVARSGRRQTARNGGDGGATLVGDRWGPSRASARSSAPSVRGGPGAARGLSVGGRASVPASGLAVLAGASNFLSGAGEHPRLY